MLETIIKRFDAADEIRSFKKGRFEIINIGGMTIGRAIYEPGWVWTTHVGDPAGEATCMVEHVGLVIAGHAKVKMDDGTEADMREGDLFYVPPGHDSWVVGDQPYVSLHFMGAGDYAAM